MRKTKKSKQQVLCLGAENAGRIFGDKSLGPRSPMKSDGTDEIASLGLAGRKVSATVSEQKQQEDRASATHGDDKGDDKEQVRQARR